MVCIYIYAYIYVNFHACIHAYLDVTCLACRSHDCPSTSGGLWLRHFGVGHHRCESHSVSGKHLRCSCGLGVWQGPSTVSGWILHRRLDHLSFLTTCKLRLLLWAQFCWKSEIQDLQVVACRLQSKHQCLGTNRVPLSSSSHGIAYQSSHQGLQMSRSMFRNWSF